MTTIRLGEVAKIKHGFAFKSQYFTEEKGSYMLLTPGNFQPRGGYQPHKPKYFAGPIPMDFVLNPSELLLLMTDLSRGIDTLGSPLLVPSTSDYSLLHNQRIGKITNLSPEVNKTWLYYRLQLADYHDYIVGTSTGSTVHHTSPSTISEFSFEIPDLKAQKKIAKVLGALDDKIAANSRIIKIATHLNINLVEKAVTKELEHLQNLADITMGSSPKGEFLNEEGIGEPFFQGVRDFGELFPSERVFAEKAVRTAQEGDILFAVRAPIGEVNIAERPCVIGRGIAAIRGKQSHLGLFYLLKGHPELWETYQSSGTVFAGINKSDLHNAVIPVLRDSEKLEQQLTPIHERAMHALRENQALARTRDELLPLLMSGRITVGEAEEAADVAGAATSES